MKKAMMWLTLIIGSANGYCAPIDMDALRQQGGEEARALKGEKLESTIFYDMYSAAIEQHTPEELAACPELVFARAACGYSPVELAMIMNALSFDIISMDRIRELFALWSRDFDFVMENSPEKSSLFAAAQVGKGLLQALSGAHSAREMMLARADYFTDCFLPLLGDSSLGDMTVRQAVLSRVTSSSAFRTQFKQFVLCIPSVRDTLGTLDPSEIEISIQGRKPFLGKELFTVVLKWSSVDLNAKKRSHQMTTVL
jgi:hypothetical protein